MWKTLQKIFHNRFHLIRSLLSPLKSGPVEYESNNPGKRGQSPVSLSHGAIAHHRPLTALSPLSSPHRRHGGPRSGIQED